MKNNRKAILTSAILLSGFFGLCFTAAKAQIYISQIQITGGTGKTTNDFVEIFNPGSEPLNLNGYRLVKRTAQGGSDTTLYVWENDAYIPPQSFYLWAHGDFTDLFLNAPTTPDATSSLSSIASNNGVALRLGGEDSGTIADSVAWGTANNGFAVATTSEPGADKALFRDNLFLATSTYNILPSAPRNSSIFYQIPDENSSTTPDTSTSTPDTSTTTPELLPREDDNSTTTPASENQASSTPEQLTESFLVKILRFLPNPSGTDSGGEWVEIISNDEKEVLLDDWMLDDESTDGKPGGSAFTLSGTIMPGKTRRFVLPEGSFALNNSGGDQVNLYFASGALGHRASYTAAAYDDGIFEFRDGQWQPPAQQSGGGGGGGSSSYVTYAPPLPLFLSEIFANPSGDDTEKEWVEIYNEGEATTSLEGYFLADGSSDAWSNSAWAIGADTMIGPKGYLTVYLSKNSITLNNSGQERVKLFSPNKQLLDSVIYEDAPECQSYSRQEDGSWIYGLATPDGKNAQGLPEYKIFISEFLPNPDGDAEEFLEIKNNATSTVSMAGFILQIGSRNKIIEEENIEPGGYLVFYEDDLPVRLSNNGQTIGLKDIFGRELCKIEYPKAEKGQAYAITESGEYAWTKSPSPEADNVFVLGEAESSAPEQPSAASKTSSSSKTKKAGQNQTVLAASSDSVLVDERIQNLEAQVNDLTRKLAALTQIAPAQAQGAGEGSYPPAQNSKTNPLLYLLLAGLSLALFIALLKWFFAGKKNPNPQHKLS